MALFAGLLGLHWTLDSRKDDTPPGTQLTFELWQSESGSYSVRMTIAMQTLAQMRELQELTRATPPAIQVLTTNNEATDARINSWEGFLRIANTRIDPTSVFKFQPN